MLEHNAEVLVRYTGKWVRLPVSEIEVQLCVQPLIYDHEVYERYFSPKRSELLRVLKVDAKVKDENVGALTNLFTCATAVVVLSNDKINGLLLTQRNVVKEARLQKKRNTLRELNARINSDLFGQSLLGNVAMFPWTRNSVELEFVFDAVRLFKVGNRKFGE